MPHFDICYSGQRINMIFFLKNSAVLFLTLLGICASASALPTQESLFLSQICSLENRSGEVTGIDLKWLDAKDFPDSRKLKSALTRWEKKFGANFSKFSYFDIDHDGINELLIMDDFVPSGGRAFIFLAMHDNGWRAILEFRGAPIFSYHDTVTKFPEIYVFERMAGDMLIHKYKKLGDRFRLKMTSTLPRVLYTEYFHTLWQRLNLIPTEMIGICQPKSDVN